MNKTVSVGLRLIVICAIAAYALGVVNFITEPVIERRKAEDLEASLSGLAGKGTVAEAVAVESNDTVTEYYPVKGQKGSVDSYILRLAATGYGGDMSVLASYSKTGEVQAVELLENSETPGLGKKAEESAYMEKFVGRGGAKTIALRKAELSKQDAEAVSGATVTYTGIAKALDSGAAFVKSLSKGSPK